MDRAIFIYGSSTNSIMIMPDICATDLTCSVGFNSYTIRRRLVSNREGQFQFFINR